MYHNNNNNNENNEEKRRKKFAYVMKEHTGVGVLVKVKVKTT